MSDNKNNNKRKTNKPRASFASRKKQQELWAWHELYTRIGTPNKKGAALIREQLKTHEEANPLLKKSNFK